MININPPPKDRRCECCDRPPKELSRFPKGQLLVKTFRGFGGCVGASWECYDCIGLTDEEYIKKRNEDELALIVKEKIRGINNIMKTSNKDCFSCGCTDYDVRYRDTLKEWYCDNCCEGME